MRRMLAAALVLGAAVIACGAPARAADAPPARAITFLVNYVFNGRHAPFFVGLDKGYYKEAGIDIHILPASGSGFVISAVDGGKADYGMVDAGTLIDAVGKGAKLKAFGVYTDVVTIGLAALKPYPEPESLKGATIASSLTDSIRVLLPIIFDMRHLDPGSVHWETATPAAYATLLFGGKADLVAAAIDSDVPALEKLAAKQGKSIHFSSFAAWGYDAFGYMLVTTDALLKERPDEVRKFWAATARAVAYAIAHPEEAARDLVKYNPTLDYDTSLAQWRQTIKAIETAYAKRNGYGVATPERLQRTIDFVARVRKLARKPTPDDIFAMGFAAP